MPFGLRNVPATFQWLMNMVLFKRLAAACLTIDLAKCELARATRTYLGHIVGQGRLRPVQAKVVVIERFDPPTTKKELMGDKIQLSVL